MIGLIVAMVGGVLAAVIGLLAGMSGTSAIWLAVVTGLLVFGALVGSTVAAITRSQAKLEVRFPAAAEGETAGE